MVAPAQGLNKVFAFGKQTGIGVPKIGAGCFKLRRKTAVFTAAVDTSMNDEIVSHRQDTGVTFGQKKTTGKIDGNISPGTYYKFIAAALMKDFAAVAAYAAGIDVTAAASAPHFVDASGGFLTAGLKVGMVGRWTGFAGGGATANNDRNFWITALTATNMTGIFLDGTAVAADAAGDSVTFTVVGMITNAPLTGHTNDYYTFESWQSDISKSELFPDCKFNQIATTVPATGPSTISIDVVGLGTRTLGTSQAMTSPTAETSTDIVEGVRGALYVNGALTSYVQSFSLTIDRGITPIGASLGSAVSPAHNEGRVKVSGSFSVFYDSSTLSDIFDAQNTVSLALVTVCDGTATSDFVGFTMGKISVTSDQPDDGEKVIIRTFNFTAEMNGEGGAALAFDQTILMVQDSAAT